MSYVRRLSLHHLVGQLKDLFKFITQKDKYLIRPLWVLHVVDAVLPFRDDSKVVSCSA